MSEKEHGIFERYYLEQMRPRWERMKQVKELERTYNVEKVGIGDRLFVYGTTVRADHEIIQARNIKDHLSGYCDLL